MSQSPLHYITKRQKTRKKEKKNQNLTKVSETCLARTNLKWTEVPVLLHFNFLYEPRHDWQYHQLLAPLKIPKLWTLVSEFLLCVFFSSLLYCLFWIYQEGMSTKTKNKKKSTGYIDSGYLSSTKILPVISTMLTVLPIRQKQKSGMCSWILHHF